MASGLELYELLRRETSGESARALATRIWLSDRTMSYDRFAESARFCLDTMREYGLRGTRLQRYPADGKTRFGDLTMPRAWDCEHAELICVSEGAKWRTLCDYAAEPLSIAQGCAATPKAGIEGDVVAVRDGTKPSDYAGLDVKGKFVLTDAMGATVAAEAVRRGAVAVVSYAMPTAAYARRAPWDNADGRLWQRVEPGKGQRVFVLSPRAGEQLRREAAAGNGPVRVRATVRSRHYAGHVYAVTGTIPGRTSREIVIIPHLFEPGANDNASGCGCALELARTVLRLRRAGRLPKLTLGIRLLFPMEFLTTLAFFESSPGIRERTVAGIVPDMVGQNQSQCGSALLCQTTPDAAPSFINALMRETLRSVRGSFGHPRGREREPYWHSASRGYWGNDCFVSDPSVGIPTIGLIEWPDRFYHSSTDTPDKLCPDTLSRNAALVGAIALSAATMDAERAVGLLGVIAADAVDDLERAALALGSGDAPDAEEGAARLRHIVRREQGALTSVLECLPRASARVGPVGAVQRLSEEIARAAAEAARRHGVGRGGAAPQPRATAAERRAGTLVPKRVVMGDLHFPDVDAAARRKLERLRRKGLPPYLLMWIDGKRTVAEVVDACRGESGHVDTGSVLNYLTFLAEQGYIEWVDASGRAGG